MSPVYRLHLLVLLLAVLLSAQCAFADQPESTPAAKQAAGASFGAVLQGDSAAALRALATVPPSQYFGKAAGYRTCMIARFDRTSPPHLIGEIKDPFAHATLNAYQEYWWRALSAPAQRNKLTAALLQTLRGLIGGPAATVKDFDALEPILAGELRKHGYYALQGETAPLRELMLWGKQVTREYDVALPEGPQHVTVNLLDDFVSKGWSQYGSCGLGGTGGWTDDKAIYALAPEYPDLQAEEYRVSLLAHEAQHFADKQRAWKLADWELEYRAKLTELALADQTSHKLLEAFEQNQGDDLSVPHSYANQRVLTAIAQRLHSPAASSAELEKVPLHTLQATARDTLIADTSRRQVGTAPGATPKDAALPRNNVQRARGSDLTLSG